MARSMTATASLVLFGACILLLPSWGIAQATGTPQQQDDPGGWLNLGTDLAKKNQYTQAVDAYQRALKLKPDYAEAWWGIALVYERQCQFSQVVPALTQAFRLDPKYADQWEIVGLVSNCRKEDVRQAAVSALEMAAQQGPGEGWLAKYLGLPQSPVPSPPAPPLLLQEVAILKPGAIFGCKGRLEASPEQIAWIDSRDCWTSSTVTLRFPDIEVLTFETFVTGTSVFVKSKTADNPVHLTVRENQAKKLSNYLALYAPQLPQRCFLSGYESHMNKSTREMPCDAWSAR
jgi:tetratricopeptide (TPR) repeat protein